MRRGGKNGAQSREQAGRDTEMWLLVGDCCAGQLKTSYILKVFGVQMWTSSSEIRKLESETKIASFLFSDCLTADGRARQCGRRARWPEQDRALFHKKPGPEGGGARRGNKVAKLCHD